jgi:hypothetical protein
MKHYYKTNLKMLDSKETIMRHVRSQITYKKLSDELTETGSARTLIIPRDLVKKTIESISMEPTSVIVFWFIPGTTLVPHIDESRFGPRKSCLSWYLQPDMENFAPTLFYDDNDNIIGKYYYDEYGSILNTRMRHGMINNNFHRYLLQLNYNREPEDFERFLVAG